MFRLFGVALLANKLILIGILKVGPGEVVC
jgi:hypothetical protein